jgi:hypothetical protein
MHRSIPAIVALSTLFPAFASGQVLNAKLKSGQVALRNICVMPVEADWTKVGLIAGQPKPKEADEWSAQLWPVITGAIVKAGAQDASDTIAPAKLSKDENVRQIVFQLQQKFDATARLENWHASGFERGRFSLGDEVMLAPCAARADALLFVRARVSSPRLVRFAEATLQLTFVDSKSGEFLAQGKIHTLGDDFLKKPEKAYADLLAERFRTMRLGR